jgi:hypothetical protein
MVNATRVVKMVRELTMVKVQGVTRKVKEIRKVANVRKISLWKSWVIEVKMRVPK